MIAKSLEQEPSIWKGPYGAMPSLKVNYLFSKEIFSLPRNPPPSSTLIFVFLPLQLIMLR